MKTLITMLRKDLKKLSQATVGVILVWTIYNIQDRTHSIGSKAK